MSTVKTFDETYPKYEFSDLVRLSLLIGTWIGQWRRAREDRHAVPGDGATTAA